MEWFGLALALAGGIGSAVVFNRMVALRQLAANAWSDIDVLLKQRYDLIDNLVAAVKGYAAFEKSTLEEVAALRSRAQAASGLTQKGEAEKGLSEGLNRFFAVVENYPDLKAGQQFRDLQAQLIRQEDLLQSARRYYNAVVRDHNTYLQSFPNNLLCQVLSYSPKEFFQVEEEARSAPKVRLDK